MSAWETVALKDVARIERLGVNPADLPPDTYYLGLEHIARGGEIIGSSTNQQAKLASTKFKFDKNHVLFGKLRPNLGKVARPKMPGICSTDILPIRPGPRLESPYLLHFLRQPSIISFAASRASGANLPRLSPTSLGSFKLPLPPVETQRRIASILDEADAIRATRRAQLAHLDELPQALFHEMFGALPADKTFGNLMHDGPTNGLYKPSSAYGDGTPILRIDGFSNGQVHNTPWKRVNASEGEQERFSLRVGDIIINRVNALSHLGKSALIESLDEGSIFESNMMRVRLRASAIHPIYAIACLQTGKLKHQISKRAKKAINQASINQRDVRSLRIPLPSIDAQTLFATQVGGIRAERDRVARALEADDELFAALQHRAFRGEL